MPQPYDPRFLDWIGQIESSGGRDTAHRPVTSGSHAGTSAIGTYGLMPKTAADLGFPGLSEGHPDERKAAEALAQQLADQFGGEAIPMALSWYSGPEAGKRYKKSGIKALLPDELDYYNKFERLAATSKAGGPEGGPLLTPEPPAAGPPVSLAEDRTQPPPRQPLAVTAQGAPAVRDPEREARIGAIKRKLGNREPGLPKMVDRGGAAATPAPPPQAPEAPALGDDERLAATAGRADRAQDLVADRRSMESGGARRLDVEVPFDWDSVEGAGPEFQPRGQSMSDLARSILHGGEEPMGEGDERLAALNPELVRGVQMASAMRRTSNFGDIRRNEPMAGPFGPELPPEDEDEGFQVQPIDTPGDFGGNAVARGRNIPTFEYPEPRSYEGFLGEQGRGELAELLRSGLTPEPPRQQGWADVVGNSLAGMAAGGAAGGSKPFGRAWGIIESQRAKEDARDAGAREAADQRYRRAMDLMGRDLEAQAMQARLDPGAMVEFEGQRMPVSMALERQGQMLAEMMEREGYAERDERALELERMKQRDIDERQDKSLEARAGEQRNRNTAIMEAAKMRAAASGHSDKDWWEAIERAQRHLEKLGGFDVQFNGADWPQVVNIAEEFLNARGAYAGAQSGGLPANPMEKFDKGAMLGGIGLGGGG